MYPFSLSQLCRYRHIVAQLFILNRDVFARAGYAFFEVFYFWV